MESKVSCIKVAAVFYLVGSDQKNAKKYTGMVNSAGIVNRKEDVLDTVLKFSCLTAELTIPVFFLAFF